jgi:UDP-N-acetylglucosamine 2-epimerase
MRVLTVIGNRPQFIKAAAVSQHLRRSTEEVLVHTGQHYDRELSDVFFEELDVPPPDHMLGAGSGSTAEQTGRIMTALEPLVAEISPDAVLVYGDTNSTLAGALVAAKATRPLAHAEAGMRSFDRSMPEEVNRIVADRLSGLLLCSTGTAVENLEREGLGESARLVGDVMVDLALALGPVAEQRSGALERCSRPRPARPRSSFRCTRGPVRACGTRDWRPPSARPESATSSRSATST